MCPQNFNLMVQNGPTKKIILEKGTKTNVRTKKKIIVFFFMSLCYFLSCPV
jgi:hypothetical protein